MPAPGQRQALPKAWTQYKPVRGPEQDFPDLLAHGVGLVSSRANTVVEAREALAVARRFGMKYSIDLPDITERASLVIKAGLEPAYARMIGGAYRGKAIDRHLFRFTAARHDILIEPPVYNPKLPYTRGSGGSGVPKASDPIGHYWPEMPAPLKAEIVVPLRKFDGRQHLKIVTAEIVPAPAGAVPENDTAMGLPPCPEILGRKLYRLRFDLSGLDAALLDQVGIAVYWAYRGSSQYWLFGQGTLSASAASTRQALRGAVQSGLAVWSEANGGRFPSDTVLAARFGDESFYLTGHIHLGSPAVSYPLWDYGPDAIREFRRAAGDVDFPRTWGYPEIYGPDAYAWWLYGLHKSTADLAGIVREEIAKTAPGLLVFRNTTRGGAFSLANDHDGSGPELLSRQLDLLHLDPYPVTGNGYSSVIPRDMSYHAGLARRYGKPLIPWLQAHTYTMGKEVLTHVSPTQIERMGREHLQHGVDAVIWLGYCPDCTFPAIVPESWERAKAVHRELEKPRAKPAARLAVLRGYRTWAQSSLLEGLIRNPGDWELQQLLEVWAVKHGQAYDVFELAPALSGDARAALAKQLARYPWVVSTEPWKGAWIVGEGRFGTSVDPATAAEVQSRFEKQLTARGWLRAATP
jgi:hypothetical protein